MARKTSSASAMRGTALGCTNELTSIQGKPASDSRSTKRTLTSVGMGAASFCSPSRGPTSTMRTRRGRTSAIRLLYGPALLRRANREQTRPTADLFANLDAHVGHDACVRRLDNVLHLHCFEHHQGLVLDHVLAGFDRHPHHTAGHRRRQTPGAATGATVGSRLFDRRRACPPQAIRPTLPLNEASIRVDLLDTDRLVIHAEATRLQRRAAQRSHAHASFAEHNLDGLFVGLARGGCVMATTGAAPVCRLIES